MEYRVEVDLVSKDLIYSFSCGPTTYSIEDSEALMGIKFYLEKVKITFIILFIVQ